MPKKTILNPKWCGGKDLSLLNAVGIAWIVFLGMGAFWYLVSGNPFFLFDLPYIGTSLALGGILSVVLPPRWAPYGRRVTQLMVGLYILIYIGLTMKVSMQIESFFFYTLAGAVGGATIHYIPSKLLGPIIFNRGFCGWACWTAMVLDFLPWKAPQTGRIKGAGIIRYLHFCLSFGLVFFLFFGRHYFPKSQSVEVIFWMAIGNALYYAAGIPLAYSTKDNRAFCKYLCPIPVVQKILGRFALFKVCIDRKKCVGCGLCETKCPMDIKLLDYARAGKRVLSTECILCAVCVTSCPQKAIGISAGFDAGFRDSLRMKNKFLRQ